MMKEHVLSDLSQIINLVYVDQFHHTSFSMYLNELAATPTQELMLIYIELIELKLIIIEKDWSFPYASVAHKHTTPCEEMINKKENKLCWNKMCLTLPLESFDDNKVLKIVNWIC